MGTRHSQMVINKVGETKVVQYGQWDGYPSGQGVDILAFLRDADLNKYDEEVSKLIDAKSLYNHAENFNPHYDKINKWVDEVQKRKLPSAEEREIFESNDEYYCLSRDCGSKLHKMIYEGRVKVVRLDEEGKDWCEGFYTIDLQKGIFHAEYHGKEATFKLSNLPSDEDFIEALKDEY